MNYTTQMDAAKKGIITEAMKIVAIKEGKPVEEIRVLVAEGKVAIPANKNHKSLSPEGVGQGLRTKINVIKEYFPSITMEVWPMTVEQYRVVVKAGAEDLTIY